MSGEEESRAAEPGEGLVGRSYTRARRHPWVIGKIQGWTIPLGPFTATQLGVLLVGLWLLVQTYGLWSRLGVLAAVVIAAPFAATWAVRHATIEGRAPLRALGGFLALVLAPRRGWIRGRPVTTPRPSRMRGLLTITPLPTLRRRRAPSTPAAPPSGGGTRGPRPTPLQRLLAESEEPGE